MAKVYIELDYEVVEQAIRAKVPDAVEDVLRRYDLQRIVESAITDDKKPERKREGGYSFTELMFHSTPQSPRERFENTLNEAIGKAIEVQAAHWLRDHPDMLRGAIERAMPKALKKIKLRLVEDDDDD